MRYLMIGFALFLFMADAWAEDPVGTHNMLLVGDQPIYASHLPMFTRTIHRYQAVYKVELDEAGNEIPCWSLFFMGKKKKEWGFLPYVDTEDMD